MVQILYHVGMPLDKCCVRSLPLKSEPVCCYSLSHWRATGKVQSVSGAKATHFA